MPSILNVDWRQIKRWGIQVADVPRDAIVRFKEPTLWETHPVEIVTATAAFLLLTGLVAGLLVERYRRRRAELTEVRQRGKLARAMRLAIAGELTASIAHEINQPLGAILNNVAAADLMLQSGADRRDELRATLSDIRRDNLRASEVIRRLRKLFAKHEIERGPVEVGETFGEVANILRAEAQRRRIALNFRPAPAGTVVLGDRIEIAQVLMNLILNAMDAVADQPGERRSIVVSAAKVPNGVCISVHDRGQGISAEQLPILFDSFFTTKREGLGLGLAIVRTIVEAHHGRVWAENGSQEGAIFHVELPTAVGAEMSLAEAT
jgi:signal transduction histidine kinase